LRDTPGVIPIVLKVRIGCEADDMYLHGTIGMSKTTFQAPVELGQQRQDSVLVGSKVSDSLCRYSGNEHKCCEVASTGHHPGSKPILVEH